MRSAEEPSLCKQQETWKKHFPPNLAESFTCFWTPNSFPKTLFWHQKARSQLIYFIHMVPRPILGTHPLWHSLPTLLLHQQIPVGKLTLGSSLTLFPPSKVSLKWTLIFWCFNFMTEGVSLLQKSAWFGQPKARLLETIFTGHLLFLKRGVWGRPPAGTGNWVMDSGTWGATVHGVAKTQTRQSNWAHRSN